jgi:GNAT superfamily N-acetyltransferase
VPERLLAQPRPELVPRVQVEPGAPTDYASERGFESAPFGSIGVVTRTTGRGTIPCVDVVIRPPTPGDAEGLARAARDLAEQYAVSEPERFQIPDEARLTATLVKELAEAAPDGFLWLVAELDGAAVGEAQAQLQEPVADAAIQPSRDVGLRRVYLNYLAVQAQHRGCGLGGLLLGAVEEWARESGAELLVTDTNLRSNLGAVEFYERHGFERQAVILRKRLA